MARVAIADAARAPQCTSIPGYAARGVTSFALFDRPEQPIHVHLHELSAGGQLSFGTQPADRVAYVWQGAVTVGETQLDHGSSIIVERTAQTTLVAGDEDAKVITFTGSHGRVPEGRSGGSVHLLPSGRVPRYEEPNGLIGALHADGACETCSAWLHENSFPPSSSPIAREAAEAGIHCHSEDEVIFVVAGEMRLGAKLFGPGTAIAIAANAMYGFTPGPDGLHFLNFRAEQPTHIRFKNGHSVDEGAYWRDRVEAPEYSWSTG